MIELPFHEYVLILGMDWLSEHRAIVDCDAKRVVLKLSDDYEVVVEGENNMFLSNMVSAMEANRLLFEGGEAYLGYVMNPGVKGVRV